MLAPPLLVSYSSLPDYLAALDPELRAEYENEITKLVERNLPPVVSSRCLAVLFGYSTRFVNALSQESWRYYRTFTIRQRNKRREIQAPRVALKIIQKWFGHHLSEAITINKNVYGFVSGKSAPKAAAEHVNAKWVYSVDIVDFFPSTPKSIVTTSLSKIGYSRKAASLLGGLLCYQDSLAQGSPASPVISNLVFQDVDEELEAVASKHDVRFTRYADDIVFSGVGDFPPEIKRDAHEIFKNGCWQLSEEKEHYAELPRRLKVHGLLVHGENIRLTKGYRNRIRAYKHMLEQGNVRDEDIPRITGHIKYAESIEKTK